jgi:transmembrane sensor
MPDPQDWHLIDRYLAGEASRDEIAQVHARTKSDPAWAKALDQLRADFNRTPAPAQSTDQAWSRLQARLNTSTGAITARTGNRQLTPPAAHDARRWLRAAAVIVIVAGSLTTWRLLASRNAANGREPNAALAGANEINTPNGSRQTITFGDGSIVTLNAGSRLRWVTAFTPNGRDVYLDGEAYFSVTHDAARPFRVHARGTVAHDLGTRFTVRAYPELPNVEVVVAEGAVSLRHDRPTATDSAVLSAGQLGRLGDTGIPSVESNVNVDRWTAWTGGALVLEGLTLADALPQIERRFDVDITVADTALAQRHVQARFHDETLGQVLDALSLALGARWTRSGGTVTLSPSAQ